jgi:hypothetical protein
MVNFVSFAADANLDAPLQALPGGARQSPHWGYVIAERMRFVFDDHEDVYEAGDALYQPPTSAARGRRYRASAVQPPEKIEETKRALAK